MRELLLAATTYAALTTAVFAQDIGDPANGEQVFKRCIACHKVGPVAANGIGPALNGIVGRVAGTYPGYAYSDANKNSGVTWNVETLQAYLPAPREFMPGTKMAFGLSGAQDVRDVIAYLAQFNDDGSVAP